MTLQDQSRIRAGELVRLALEARDRGRFAEAEELLRRALAARPGDAGVLRQLADVLVQGGRPDAGLPLYDAVLGARPDDADVLHNRGVTLLALGRAADAAASLGRAVELQPGYVSAHYNRGVALNALGRPAEAAQSYARAVELEPRHGAALNNLGALLVEQGQPARALDGFEQVLALDPDDAAALANRGNALCLLGRPREALASCERALALQPRNLAALVNRGLALKDLGRAEAALEAFDLALSAAPDNADAHCNRGNLLYELGRPGDAVPAYDRAIRLRPGYAEAHSNRGNVLRELERPDEALRSLERAVALKPGLADAWENQAVVLVELGRVDEAIAAVERVIALEPRRLRASQMLVELRKATPGDAAVAVLEAAALNESSLPAEQRIRLNYGLGKAYGDLGDADRAFARYAAGAALKRAEMAYDEAAAMAIFAGVAKAFTPAVMRRKAGKGEPSGAPVFVLGMPRSGTTLVEQIIAAHPLAHAAGETPAFADAMDAYAAGAGGQPTGLAGFAALPAAALKAIGRDYLGRIAAAAPKGAARIVNKTTVNFLALGTIAMALPEARVVHVRRDAADTCWSCFTKLFVRDQPHTYDLGELGRYHRAYETLMDHWRSALPGGVMIEVQYEALVADLEGQARRVVAHCGLEWDPACLDFHKAARQVRTASVTQVRQPIYASSIGRWRAYERHLGRLLEALGRA